uniref:Uncharacterized protein n=1 Tax=Ciona intestinalis TaxID=7719 RepID=F7AUD7_CIOIN
MNKSAFFLMLVIGLSVLTTAWADRRSEAPMQNILADSADYDNCYVKSDGFHDGCLHRRHGPYDTNKKIFDFSDDVADSFFKRLIQN